MQRGLGVFVGKGRIVVDDNRRHHQVFCHKLSV
jgi:hypothetical protein